MSKAASDNTALALALAAAGVAIFPCQWEGEAAKRPMPGVYWRKEATTGAAQVAAWWRGYPQALPGHAVGKSGLFVVDVDCHEGAASGVEAWAELTAKHGDPAAPCVTTPSGGRHYYFRQPEGEPLGNSPGALPKGIDVRGDGGFVIAPGAKLPDGRRYSDLAFGFGLDAPEAPAWLLELIRAAPPERERPNLQLVRPAPVSSTADAARVRAYTENAIAGELATLRGAGEGRRNNTLNEAAFSIGTLIGAGWLGETDGRETLLAVALEIGLGRAESLATINSGINAGKAKPREMPPERGDGPANMLGAMITASLLRDSDGTLYDGRTGEIYREVPPPEASQDTAWLQPDGLIGDIADWILETTPAIPQRPFAVMVATQLVSAATFRTLATPTRASLALYATCLGRTGCGKNWPQDAARLILAACGPDYKGLITGGSVKSDVALENKILSKPSCILVIDEIGAKLFEPILSKRGNHHMEAISGVLRSVWGANFGAVDTSESAARAGHTLYAPSISILGMSTPQEFYDALDGGAVTNGFLNRFLLVDADPDAVKRTSAGILPEVPKYIVNGICGLVSGGDLNVYGRGDTVPRYDIMRWGPGGEESHVAYEKVTTARIKMGALEEAVYVRAPEMAVRLATIHAAGRGGRGADVTAADYQWAKALAEHSAMFMFEGCRDRMSKNEHQTKHQAVERIIKESGGHKGITRSQLLRKIQGSMRAKEVGEIVDALMEAETIARVADAPLGGVGRPGTTYVHKKWISSVLSQSPSERTIQQKAL